ncbi:MAG: hypothetical protein AAGC93_10380 [Cyanobacteria bacterium P01_F01_bin.53]
MPAFNSAYSAFFKSYVKSLQPITNNLANSSQGRFVVVVAACLSSALWQLPSQGQEISRTTEIGNTPSNVIVIESSASYSLTEAPSGIEYRGASQPVRFIRAETTTANRHTSEAAIVETEVTTEDSATRE